ncbi:hypothetical protein AVEN_166436-1 [Araneus ventricosus]|uniref:Uncharacterized protein n=1 Tax=Araneus ventricosus TaxID=182803 RepID=A0A4Y2EXQ8_ARAVE|nr:hypothetical protein AVEN_166436-1 [Araneus ventricosus]
MSENRSFVDQPIVTLGDGLKMTITWWSRLIRFSFEVVIPGDKRREKEFGESLDNLFDIAHADKFQSIKIEEDKVFLLRQRELGRVGYLGGIDKKLSEKEEKVLEKKEIEEKRREKKIFLASTSSAVSYVSSSEESIKEVFTSDESNDIDISCHFSENTQNQDVLKRGTKNFITPKLVASLDRCQLSVRYSVHIIHAVVEALGHNTEEYY